ncbi:MAG: sigma-70 family RNA polymerase sigma factor, partial [Gemmatimonadetes bacterium]|nr:sigma-70 family RNA polymerase sigma factor [Gemmatimonadota bacterium]
SDGVRATENRLTLDAVRQAFARLSEEHRVVLLLACVEGFTYKEIAETLGIPTGTVMSRLARARLALYREIEPARGDPGDNVIKMG